MSVNSEQFPTHVFPKGLEAFVMEASEAINCPVDFIALSVLSSFALAIGSKAVAEVKRDWTEPPILFAAIVAEPGAKKSPALKMGTLAINQLQKEYADTYNSKKEAYWENLKSYEDELSAWKLLNKSEKQEKEKPVKPFHPNMDQIITNDATIEALTSLLQKQPQGVLFIQDELIAWVKGMNQYRQGNGSDMEKWLSLWGSESILINRKSDDEPLYLNRPFVCVLGCIQPDVLEDLAKNKDNGFLDRILFVLPEPVKLNYTEKEVPDDLKFKLNCAFKKVYCHNMDSLEAKTIKFTKESQKRFQEYLNNEIYHEMDSDDLPYYLRGMWSKFAGYTVRFALIIEAAKFGYGKIEFEEIDKDSLEKAIELTRFFMAQAKKVQAILHSSLLDRKIDKAVKWMRKRGGKCSLRDIYTKKLAGCKNKTQAQKLVDEMLDRSLISTEKTKPTNGGKESILIFLKASVINRYEMA